MLTHTHTRNVTHSSITDTPTKVVSCIHIIHIFPPLYQARLFGWVSRTLAHTPDTALPSHTGGDEYSCFQQLASSERYSAIICNGCHERYKDVFTHVCVTPRLGASTKTARTAAAVSNAVTAFYLFGYKTEEKMI